MVDFSGARSALGKESSAPVRILHVITGLGRGGSETALSRLVGALDPERFTSRVVALNSGGAIQAELSAQGIQTDCIRHESRMPSLSSYFRLQRIAREFHPDVIQGWLPHGNLAAFAIAKFTRAAPKLAWNVRQSLYDLAYEPIGTRLIIRACSPLSLFTDRIVYNSSVGCSQHEQLGYDSSKSLLIYNGFDTELFRPDQRARTAIRAELGVDQSLPLIGMVARLHPHKDHATFFQAARRLLDTGPRADFLLAGAGMHENNESLRNQIAAHGLESVTHLLGERTDIHRIFASLDIAALSSYTEAFPNVLGEAMACAVPCVATDVGEARKIVGDCGIVVEPRNPDAMAAGFRQLLSASADTRRILGENARRRIEEEWSADATVRKYGELYSMLAAGNPSQPKPSNATVRLA